MASPRTDQDLQSDLERAADRRRRFSDAVRLLPILAALLFLFPLLLGDGWSTAWVGLYIFAVWFAMIVAIGLLSRQVDPGPDEAAEPSDRYGPPQR